MLNVYTLQVKTKKIVERSSIKFIKEANPYSNCKICQNMPVWTCRSDRNEQRRFFLLTFNMQRATTLLSVGRGEPCVRPYINSSTD